MKNKNLIIRAIPILFILSAIVNIISVESIHLLHGDSKTINYAGIIRGAAQKLVKQEITNIQNDRLINEIYNIILELKEDDRSNIFMLAKDSQFQEKLLDIEISFTEMVEEIYRYRYTNNPQRLYQLSENFFEESNELVFYAQKYSEEKMRILGYLRPILYVSIISVILIYLYQTYSIKILKYKKDKIELLAYTDSLTRLPNRTYLNKIIGKYKQMILLPTLACIFFDLNNLKVTNDALGHDTGDKLLLDFSKIIRKASREYGLVIRNGGDEFVGIFENCTENDIEIFKKNLNRQIEIYNKDEKIKLSVAMGVSYSNIDANTIEELITIADRRMYEDKKRKSKICI